MIYWDELVYGALFLLAIGHVKRRQNRSLILLMKPDGVNIKLLVIATRFNVLLSSELLTCHNRYGTHGAISLRPMNPNVTVNHRELDYHPSI